MYLVKALTAARGEDILKATGSVNDDVGKPGVEVHPFNPPIRGTATSARRYYE